MRIRYNAPVTLTMALLSALVLLAGQFLSQNFVVRYFSTPAPFNSRALLDYLKLFTHLLGHANIQHYIANFTMILLLGPILEAVYGSGFILLSVLLTALATGLANVLLFPNVI
ncbi:MAG: rhomboid family intramembrane serine protease, partial [Rectinemataceae bacterium]